MRFAPIAHITGVHAAPTDLISRAPWVYLMLSEGSQILYIGETYEEGGLVGRVARHFGPYSTSTLKQRADIVTRVRRLRPPFLVVCARLPFADEATALDASSKEVRLAYEMILHELVGLRFVAPRGNWTIVSTPTGSSIGRTIDIEESCASIYDCFAAAYSFLRTLSQATPIQVIVLERESAAAVPTEEDVGVLVENVEIAVYSWLMAGLKQRHGERWWQDGVPENIRVECVTRRERELLVGALPPEAYLTLIDLREVARRNWDLFGPVCEQVSGTAGKDKATQWIVDVNDIRKIWAHPIKRLHWSFDPAPIMRLRTIWEKARTLLPPEGT